MLGNNLLSIGSPIIVPIVYKEEDMAPKVGSQAINSTWQVLWDNRLRVDDTRYISLTDYRGKAVVLIFVEILG